MKTESLLRNLARFVAVLSGKTVSLCLFVIIFMVAADIVLRTFFGDGIPGTVEAGEYLLVVVGFIGIAQTYSAGGHITVDLLYDRLPESLKRAFVLISDLLMLAFCLLFLYAGLQKAVAAFHVGETNWFGAHVLPVWMFRWIVPFSCLLLCLQIVIKICQEMRMKKQEKTMGSIHS